MPRLLKWIIAGARRARGSARRAHGGVLVLDRDTPEGALDTDLSGVTVTTATYAAPATDAAQAGARERQALLARTSAATRSARSRDLA